MERVARAMTFQNRFVQPHGYHTFRTAYVIGEHIWFVKRCAEEWVSQVEPDATIEMVSYEEAYKFGKQHNLF